MHPNRANHKIKSSAMRSSEAFRRGLICNTERGLVEFRNKTAKVLWWMNQKKRFKWFLNHFSGLVRASPPVVARNIAEKGYWDKAAPPDDVFVTICCWLLCTLVALSDGHFFDFFILALILGTFIAWMCHSEPSVKPKSVRNLCINSSNPEKCIRKWPYWWPWQNQMHEK